MELPQLHLRNHNPNVYKPNHDTFMLHCIIDIALCTHTYTQPYSGCITPNMASASYTSSFLSNLVPHCHTLASDHTLDH
jgi:hypothetical protein